MRTRSRVVAILLLLLSFAVGGLSGMAAEEGFGLDWFDFLDEDSSAGGGRLLRGMSLTAGQQARADSVLDRQEDRLEEYWEARMPEIREIMERSQAELRALLTPAQQETFDRRVHDLGDKAMDTED